MRILVTGPRIWTNEEIVYDALTDTFNLCLRYGSTITFEPKVVVHGGAKGLDLIVDSIAKEKGWATELHYPNYGKYPPRLAPLMRNQEMVDSGINVCLAFLMECPVANCKRERPHYTHGTADCMARAMKAGVPVRKYEDGILRNWWQGRGWFHGPRA